VADLEADVDDEVDDWDDDEELEEAPEESKEEPGPKKKDGANTIGERKSFESAIRVGLPGPAAADARPSQEHRPRRNANVIMFGEVETDLNGAASHSRNPSTNLVLPDNNSSPASRSGSANGSHGSIGSAHTPEPTENEPEDGGVGVADSQGSFHAVSDAMDVVGLSPRPQEVTNGFVGGPDCPMTPRNDAGPFILDGRDS